MQRRLLRRRGRRQRTEHPPGEFGEDAAEQGGVGDAGGHAREPTGGTSAAQGPLNLVEGAGLPDPLEAGEGGVDEVEEHPGGVPVVVEGAVADLVAGGGVIPEAAPAGAETWEVLEAAEVAGGKGRVVHGRDRG